MHLKINFLVFQKYTVQNTGFLMESQNYYHMRTRCSGAIYILSPGLTSKVS